MPQYYFDLNDGSDILDEIGRPIDGPVALRREALRVVTKLVAEEGEDAGDTTLVLTVRTEDGSPRLRVRLVCQVESL